MRSTEQSEESKKFRGRIAGVRSTEQSEESKKIPRKDCGSAEQSEESEQEEEMRLDKYLKVSRLIKRRTIANEACDAGRVTVNDKVAKASQDVKVGDVIAIRFGDKTVKAEVLLVQETVRKEDAKEMFRYI